MITLRKIGVTGPKPFANNRNSNTCDFIILLVSLVVVVLVVLVETRVVYAQSSVGEQKKKERLLAKEEKRANNVGISGVRFDGIYRSKEPGWTYTKDKKKHTKNLWSFFRFYPDVVMEGSNYSPDPKERYQQLSKDYRNACNYLEHKPRLIIQNPYGVKLFVDVEKDKITVSFFNDFLSQEMKVEYEFYPIQ